MPPRNAHAAFALVEKSVPWAMQSDDIPRCPRCGGELLLQNIIPPFGEQPKILVTLCAIAETSWGIGKERDRASHTIIQAASVN